MVTSNPFDFFDRGQAYELATEPIRIKVKPLPTEGKPDNFSGAVGQFSIEASTDKSEVKTGDALTLTVVVSGRGNVKTIAEPSLPDMKDFDIYESKSDEKINKSAGGISGRKTFSYVIVPRREGEVVWPGIDLWYFDPAVQKYVRRSTGEISFKVLPGEKQDQGPVYRLPEEKILSLGEDINYIKETPNKALVDETSTLIEGKQFWMLHILPLLMVVVAFGYRRHLMKLTGDRAFARLRGARRKFSAFVKEASRYLSDGKVAECYSSLDKAIHHYIGDKVNAGTTGMVDEQLLELLDRRGVSENLRKEIAECLERFDFARFASGGGDVGEAHSYIVKVKNIVSRLDNEL